MNGQSKSDSDTGTKIISLMLKHKERLKKLNCHVNCYKRIINTLVCAFKRKITIAKNDYCPESN